MALPNLAVAEFERRLIDVAENYDKFFDTYKRSHPAIFRDRIPRGAYNLFNGTDPKTNIFHQGLGEQAGLSNWREVQTSRVAANGDPGFNNCIPNPKTYNWAYETKTYTGYEASWRSPVFCVRDLMWTAEAKMQVANIVEMGVMISASVWENMGREFYSKWITDARNGLVLTESSILQPTAVKFLYDPFETFTRTTDFGVTEEYTVLRFPVGVEVSTLNWSYFDLIATFLGDECPDAALSNTMGVPNFGLMLHRLDFEQALKADPQLREDIRFSTQANILIENYPQSFPNFRGWAIIHDSRQMRFRPEKVYAGNTAAGNGTVTGTNYIQARRVLPMREGQSVTIGNLPEANPEYHLAELAVAVVLINNMYQLLVPPTLDNMGSGMTFGPTPGFNGSWMWINHPDNDKNPTGQIGYFLAEFMAFPKPLTYASKAIAVLYKRCPTTWVTRCAIGGDAAAAASTAVSVATNAALTDVDSTNLTITLTLEHRLTATVGQAVTFASVGSSTTTAYIAEDQAAPTYKFVFAPASTVTYSDFTTSSTVTVG